MTNRLPMYMDNYNKSWSKSLYITVSIGHNGLLLSTYCCFSRWPLEVLHRLGMRAKRPLVNFPGSSTLSRLPHVNVLLAVSTHKPAWEAKCDDVLTGSKARLILFPSGTRIEQQKFLCAHWPGTLGDQSMAKPSVMWPEKLNKGLASLFCLINAAMAVELWTASSCGRRSKISTWPFSHQTATNDCSPFWVTWGTKTKTKCA